MPQLWAWIESFRDRVCDDYAPKDLDGFLAEWEARAGNRRTWAVERGGEIGGMVAVEPVNPDLTHTHCLFKREFWGHETTVPALQAVYRQVFDAGYACIRGYIFADNHQMRQLALAVGFVEETPRKAPLRNCTRRDGELVSMRILSLYPEEFEQCLS